MKVVCPKCKENITLDDALTQSLQKEISKELEKKYASELTKAKDDAAKKDKEISTLKKSVKTQIEDAVEEEKKKIEKEAKKRAEDNASKQLKDLQEQIKEKSQKLEKAEEEELKLRKEKRELEEAKKTFELETERKLDEEREKIRENAQKKVEEEHELKDKEKDKQISDLAKQISDLKRKSEQGSQKLQGEVLEEALEDALANHFIHDKIDPISAGGADIVQKVHTPNGKFCGTILIESKNAKNWSNGWITKLKDDQRAAKADVGVIATTVLPEGISSFDLRDGVMIVHYRNLIPVVTLLRVQLLETMRAKSFSAGKNEKMEAMYRYLTGTEFKQKVETIVEAFGRMHDDLQKEKKAMTKNWSQREKQIENAVFGIAGMYGGMQGILGTSLPEIKSLEMADHLEEKKDTEDKESE